MTGVVGKVKRRAFATQSPRFSALWTFVFLQPFISFGEGSFIWWRKARGFSLSDICISCICSALGMTPWFCKAVFVGMSKLLGHLQ